MGFAKLVKAIWGLEATNEYNENKEEKTDTAREE